MKQTKIIKLLLAPLLLICQSCIHEYPHFIPAGLEGEKPSSVGTSIVVNYNLSWENIIHKVELYSKSGISSPHRFIIEVRDNGRTVCRDEFYLSDNQFSTGRFEHKLSTILEARNYDIGVWYDRLDEEGKPVFLADDIQKISLTNFTTTDSEIHRCAYSTETLDLQGYNGSDKTVMVEKEITLQHPGARFEIIATDVQEFITLQKEALNQGDKYTIYLNLANRSHGGFDVMAGNYRMMEEDLELCGRMRLPYDEYDELKIAEGFLFCSEEDAANMQIRVENSALLTVSKTEYFSFPIRRGYITTVRGNFLTHSMNGMFNIDTLWEDDIIMEL